MVHDLTGQADWRQQRARSARKGRTGDVAPLSALFLSAWRPGLAQIAGIVIFVVLGLHVRADVIGLLLGLAAHAAAWVWSHFPMPSLVGQR